MEIKDGVDAMSSTYVNDTIQVLETRLLKNSGIHIIWTSREC